MGVSSIDMMQYPQTVPNFNSQRVHCTIFDSYMYYVLIKFVHTVFSALLHKPQTSQYQKLESVHPLQSQIDMTSELIAQIRRETNIPPPANDFISTTDGLANIFTFSLKPGAVIYRYDVDIIDLGRDRSLTQGAGDDGKKGILKDVCYGLISTTFRYNYADTQFVYDNQKILFTNKQIGPQFYEITPAQMSPVHRQFLRQASVRVELYPCRQQRQQLSLDDIASSLSFPHEQADHSLRTFLEMLTSQPFINSGTHRIVGAGGRLFDVNHVPQLQLHPAIVAHRGISKGVRIIANGQQKPCAALVMDVKTSAFFAPLNLETIAQQMFTNRGPNVQERNFWLEFGQLFKGVSAYITYAPSRVIVIDSMTERKCGQIAFEVEGQRMTMVDYFHNRKNTTINPELPAVRQHHDRDALFPLNCLMIMPFQRLPLDKMGINDAIARVSSILLAENSGSPSRDVSPAHHRYNKIHEVASEMGRRSGPCNQFMELFGVRLRSENDVKIGQRQLPQIQFGGNRVQQPENDGRFNFHPRDSYQFLVPSPVTLRCWIVAHSRRVTQHQIGNFVDQILRTASQRGMNLPQPTWETMEHEGMKEQMMDFKGKGCQFLLYFDNKFVKSHNTLKMLERELGILTQHITVEMVQKSGAVSVGNVLAKLNMKLFGLNYMPIFDQATRAKLDFTSGAVLVLGIDTSRPPKATAYEKFRMKKQGMEGMQSEDPMVVGVCANYLKDPRQFAGDYFYQPCTQDVVDTTHLANKLKWILRQLKKNRPSGPPRTIFVIRNGISEGMVAKAINEEFQALVDICRQFHAQWAPKFVYCLVDKGHNKRFFRKDNRGNAANTGPGSVVDTKFVRVDLHEFFLQAHFPLKGTAKLPQYMIPVNQIKASSEELQSFLLSLCNMWQIVNLPPALPTPVLQAKELAKRGCNNFVELKRTNADLIPRVEQQIDFEQLNTMLAYCYQPNDRIALPMFETRFNA